MYAFSRINVAFGLALYVFYQLNGRWAIRTGDNLDSDKITYTTRQVTVCQTERTCQNNAKVKENKDKSAYLVCCEVLWCLCVPRWLSGWCVILPVCAHCPVSAASTASHWAGEGWAERPEKEGGSCGHEWETCMGHVFWRNIWGFWIDLNQRWQVQAYVYVTHFCAALELIFTYLTRFT